MLQKDGSTFFLPFFFFYIARATGRVVCRQFKVSAIWLPVELLSQRPFLCVCVRVHAKAAELRHVAVMKTKACGEAQIPHTSLSSLSCLMQLPVHVS